MISYFKNIIDIALNTSTKEQYAIKKGYRHRLKVPQYNDTHNTDKYQAEVYLEAKRIFEVNNYKKVLDIGCGSGFKLMKHFSPDQCHGVEIGTTLNYLLESYPAYNWSNLESVPKSNNFDVVILSDVIEHIDDPSQFLDQIINQIDFKKLIISTPDRDLVRKPDHMGPPNNKHHYREWTKSEFETFLQQKFNILESKISHPVQGTILCICNKN